MKQNLDILDFTLSADDMARIKTLDTDKPFLLGSHAVSYTHLDVYKRQDQYPPIEARTYKSSHDRFLIIDNTEVYHIGASLKDLCKKMFAFSKLELPAHTIIDVL